MAFLFYELTPSALPEKEAYDYSDREETFFRSKDKTPKPKGLKVFQIMLILLCVFLSIVIYGTFNFDSIP
jgi:hypothetical protein